ncbi:MAG: hypothetical protein HY695_19410 [Deltaproteobacteria bacterium]|nr:hypothetical protein [Deltaproteobacteria bacterium]
MQLTLCDFPVKEAFWGKETKYESGRLEIDKEELLSSFLRDDRIARADLDLVRPGESVRIINACDVVEPRFKVAGSGRVFPGVLGAVEKVGEGRTHRLSGFAVVGSVESHGLTKKGRSAHRSGLIDMSGPGAKISPFGSTINLVVVITLRSGLTELEANSAVQGAQLGIAERLAQATVTQNPHCEELLELTPVDSSLPRIVLVQGYTLQESAPHTDVAFYGIPVRETLATLVHPNEFFDGALTAVALEGMGRHATTWLWQNHPLVRELYRRHGKEVSFAGCILQRLTHGTHQEKEVNAINTSGVAKLAGANGAVLTWAVSGNSFMDIMMTVGECEKRGIKSVFVTYEHGGKDGTELPLLYFVPEADAIVSVGSAERWLELPPVKRVVGPSQTIRTLTFMGPTHPGWPAADRLQLDGPDYIVGGVDLFGGGRLTCRSY